MFSRKVKSSAAVALAVVAVMLTVAVAPAAAADVELVNKTVDVDENTQSVYAEINNTDTVQANYSATFEGLDGDGATVYQDNRTGLTTAAGSTDLVERTQINATTTDRVRVIVTLDDTSASQANVEATVGAIQMVASGSGGLLGGSSGPPIAVVAGLLVVGYLYTQRDE